jgi:hypothetical protein
MVHSTLADPNPNLTLTLTLTLNLTLNLTLTLTLNNINEWVNALKTHKTKNNNFKKQIKKTCKTKLSLQLFLMANFDRVNRPIDMRVWKGR